MKIENPARRINFMLIGKLENRRCYFKSLNRRFGNAAFFRVEEISTACYSRLIKSELLKLL